MARLENYLANKDVDFIELSGIPQEEIAPIQTLRCISLAHYRQHSFRSMRKNLYTCELIAFAVSALYALIDKSLSSSALGMFPMLMLGCHLLMWVFVHTVGCIMSVTYLSPARVFCCNCKHNSLPDRAIMLPDLIDPDENYEWVLMDFRHHLYAISAPMLFSALSDKNAVSTYLKML